MACEKTFRDVSLPELERGTLAKDECKCMNDLLTDGYRDDGNGGERFETIKESGCGRDRIRTVYDRELGKYYKVGRSVGSDGREHFFILMMQYYES